MQLKVLDQLCSLIFMLSPSAWSSLAEIVWEWGYRKSMGIMLQGEYGNEAIGRVWEWGCRESMGMRLQGESGDEAIVRVCEWGYRESMEMRLQGESGNEATGRVWKWGYRESLGMRLQGEYGTGAPEPVPQVPRLRDQCWKQNLWTLLIKGRLQKFWLSNNFSVKFTRSCASAASPDQSWYASDATVGMRLQGEPGNEATRCARANSFRHATHWPHKLVEHWQLFLCKLSAHEQGCLIVYTGAQSHVA